MLIFSIPDAEFETPEALAILRARQRRQRMLAGTTLVLIVAAVFTTRPALRAVKSWQARRTAAQALTLIDRQQWQDAYARAADAVALRPLEPSALRAMGRTLARTRNPGALPYYRQLRAMNALTPEDRRDFVTIALLVGATDDAREQSAWLVTHPEAAPAPGKPPLPAPADLLLAAQTASASGHEPAALDAARQVLAHPAASEAEQFTAVVRLVNAAAAHGQPNSPEAVPAWERARRLADSRGPVGLDALTLLSRRPPAAPGEPALPGWMTPADLAHALEAHPLARVQDHLLALDLTTGDDPAARAAALNTATARWRDADNPGLAALAAWLLAKGEAARALDVLPTDRARRDSALCLPRLNALATLNRWADVQAMLPDDNDALDPVSLHMYRAAADLHLDDKRAAATEWGVAQSDAGRDPDQLFALGQYAESQGATATAASAFAAAIDAAPRMRPAHEALCRLTLAGTDTAAALAALGAMLEIWPQDDAARNEENYLRLLLGAKGEDARAIEQTAAAFAAREAGNWWARATLSLARLRQGEVTTALQAFAGLHAASDQAAPAGPLAVRAAALAAAGWRDEARADARSLAGTPLRPEERALIAPLLAE